MPIPQELILVGWVERSGTQHFQDFVGFRLRSTQPTIYFLFRFSTQYTVESKLSYLSA